MNTALENKSPEISTFNELNSSNLLKIISKEEQERHDRLLIETYLPINKVASYDPENKKLFPEEGEDLVKQGQLKWLVEECYRRGVNPYRLIMDVANVPVTPERLANSFLLLSALGKLESPLDDSGKPLLEQYQDEFLEQIPFEKNPKQSKGSKNFQNSLTKYYYKDRKYIDSSKKDKDLFDRYFNPDHWKFKVFNSSFVEGYEKYRKSLAEGYIGAIFNRDIPRELRKDLLKGNQEFLKAGSAILDWCDYKKDNKITFNRFIPGRILSERIKRESRYKQTEKPQIQKKEEDRATVDYPQKVEVPAAVEFSHKKGLEEVLEIDDDGGKDESLELEEVDWKSLYLQQAEENRSLSEKVSVLQGRIDELNARSGDMKGEDYPKLGDENEGLNNLRKNGIYNHEFTKKRSGRTPRRPVLRLSE